jgi:hypothetical protein
MDADKAIVGFATYAIVDESDDFMLRHDITAFVGVKSGNIPWITMSFFKNREVIKLIADEIKRITKQNSVYMAIAPIAETIAVLDLLDERK